MSCSSKRGIRRQCAMLLGSFMLLSGVVSAQPFVQQFNPFPVVQGSDTLRNPFSGGIDNPVHQFTDIDGDTDLDLFVLDKDSLLSFYRNDGSPSQHRFILQSLRYQNLIVGSWFRFADIDSDGDLDLFANGPSATIRFFRNTGTTAAPGFVLELPLLTDTSGDPVRSEEISHPAFADPDGDGDLDFFSGNSAGVIWYYENVGTPTSFSFRFVTANYQNIQIIGFNKKRPDLTPVNGIAGGSKRLHGAMALEFADIDADGDQDLFWGDLFNQSLYYLQNQGTSTNPQFVLVDSTFADEQPVSSFGFNMPSFVDIDGDRDFDLFVGVLYFGASIDNFHLYLNLGDSATHQFQLQTTNALPSIDVGSASSPVFADIDGDGDEDLVVGGEQGTLAWFERTSSRPEFEFRSNQLAAVGGLFNVSPTFGDLDGDARKDLIVGDFNGRLRFFKNTDTGFVSTAFQLDTASFGLNASPVLVDINGDLLLDLFVGTGGGQVKFFRNTGTASAALFVLESDQFLSIDVGDDAKPAFTDLDSDGDHDFVVGSRNGNLSYFQNNGSAASFEFVQNSTALSGIAAVQRSAPAISDVEGDGDVDFVIGNVRGGLYFYENARLPVGVENEEVQSGFTLFQNYPNPFNAGTNFEFRIVNFEFVVLRIYDALGRAVETLVEGRLEPGVHKRKWNAESLASGVYFYRLLNGNSVQAKKMIVIR